MCLRVTVCVYVCVFVSCYFVRSWPPPSLERVAAEEEAPATAGPISIPSFSDTARLPASTRVYFARASPLERKRRENARTLLSGSDRRRESRDHRRNHETKIIESKNQWRTTTTKRRTIANFAHAPPTVAAPLVAAPSEAPSDESALLFSRLSRWMMTVIFDGHRARVAMPVLGSVLPTIVFTAGH